MFGIGDEVVCINDSRPNGWTSEHFPQWVKKDDKYTIREVLGNDDIVIGILLFELKNPIVYIKLINREQEGAFASWRFSKLRTAQEIVEEAEYEEISKKLCEQI